MTDLTNMTNTELANGLDHLQDAAEEDLRLTPTELAGIMEAARRLRAMDEPVEVNMLYPIVADKIGLFNDRFSRALIKATIKATVEAIGRKAKAQDE